MNLWFVLLAFVLASGAKAVLYDDDQKLPRLDDAKHKSLRLDRYDFDGGSGEKYDDDDEYFYDDEEGSGDDDYDDEEEYEDEEDEENEMTGKLIPDRDDLPKEDGVLGIENDWHFADKEKKPKPDDGLLYEYYNEIYEEDYEEDDDRKDEKGSEPTRKKDEENVTGKVLDTSYLLLMVISGLASFTVFLLAFAVCFYRRRHNGGGGGKRGSGVQATAPFYISSAFASKPQQHKERQQQQPFVRCVVPPPPPSSSIVKNYHLVPQDTKEFMSSSSALKESDQQASSPEWEKPLLP